MDQSRVIVMLDVEHGDVTEAVAWQFNEKDTLIRVLGSSSFGPFDSRWSVGSWLSTSLGNLKP